MGAPIDRGQDRSSRTRQPDPSAEIEEQDEDEESGEGDGRDQRHDAAADRDQHRLPSLSATRGTRAPGEALAIEEETDERAEHARGEQGEDLQVGVPAEERECNEGAGDDQANDPDHDVAQKRMHRRAILAPVRRGYVTCFRLLGPRTCDQTRSEGGA